MREAYDLTVIQHRAGIDPYASVPREIRGLPGYREITGNPLAGSGAADIKEYLKPMNGMRYLDGGCCANLANYRLDKWPSIYFGVDISPELIRAMKTFVEKNGIIIGGLYNTDLATMPFDEDFFDIAAMIGVLQYCVPEYAERVLEELHRVLKPAARMVLDLPNLAYPYIETMFRLEEHLGRPNMRMDRHTFERVLARQFIAERVDETGLMLKYFVRKRQNAGEEQAPTQGR
ncbi:MAG: class I SAM-dependent methyltransferase [candidate division WOR-3 bacterium]|nr:MAG: class I SAM-dependent methyltransferase [candidate division WOR-3 bacterium]